MTLTINADKVGGGTDDRARCRATSQLYGPGDVVGIDARAIVRSEPRHWITNFETNYLPFVEFYDEDFPWRYTPAKSSRRRTAAAPVADARRARGGRVRRTAPPLSDGQLPFIEVDGPGRARSRLADQLWAWAHVHVNGGLGGRPGRPRRQRGAARRRRSRANRDSAYSRLLCPRILKPNTGYHAFVIPTFETGRLAGLGKDPDARRVRRPQSAWVAGRTDPDPTSIPSTTAGTSAPATVGDFEYLVRLLKPRTVDPRVGAATSTCRMPGRESAGDHRRSAACCAWAARCARRSAR